MGKRMPIMSAKNVNNFWNKVGITADESRCWQWNGATNENDYGSFGVNYRTFASHRISYFLHYKIDPVGKIVMHSCDNPKCVNPAHLLLGTQKDNTRDMMSKGRDNFGIKNGTENFLAKLDDECVSEIRKLYSFGLKQKVLSEIYNVTQQCISSVITRKNWN